MNSREMSYLGIEGYHAFVTGARGGIGSAIVNELLGSSTVAIQLEEKIAEDAM